MIDINQIRADFARYLIEHADTRYSLDAALMHVVELAYQGGMRDALSVPAVLRDPIPDLDPGIPARVRGPLAAVAAAVPAPQASGSPHGAGQGGGAEGGNGTTAQTTEKP